MLRQALPAARNDEVASPATDIGHMKGWPLMPVARTEVRNLRRSGMWRWLSIAPASVVTSLRVACPVEMAPRELPVLRSHVLPQLAIAHSLNGLSPLRFRACREAPWTVGRITKLRNSEQVCHRKRLCGACVGLRLQRRVKVVGFDIDARISDEFGPQSDPPHRGRRDR